MSSCLSEPNPAGTETRPVVSSPPGDGSTADGEPLDADGGAQDGATIQPIQAIAKK